VQKLVRDTARNYLEPTLFTEDTNIMRISQEGIFGPVLPVDGPRLDSVVPCRTDVEFGLYGGGICQTS